ncbi:MAG: septum site-determining protein MinC [Thermacetogeniaceae bacterium]
MDDLITFKGYRDGVTLILNDKEPDFQKLLNHLKSKLSHLNFFKGAVVNIDIGQRDALSPAELDSLAEILSTKNIKIKSIILNGSNNQKPSESKNLLIPSYEKFHSDAIMVKRTIRSGQTLSHSGSIVIIGDVNPGAEVTAEGNVIVWGTLGGLVHAGSAGNKKAYIIALNLNPTQLRIAQYIGCAPKETADLPRRPEIAYLQGNRIVIEDYNKMKNMLVDFLEGT